jgi:NADPH-dependent curcumin reductase CurA
LKLLSNEEKLDWSTFVGAAGMPGKTAFMAWKEYSGVGQEEKTAAKEGEKVAYVSAGSGPVGSLVIQLAKRDGF